MSGIEGMPMYLIMFDDTEVPAETMFGEEIARKRFEQISQNWNAHLFVKVDSNSRDDIHAKSNHVCAVTAPQDSKGPLCFCGLKQTKNPHPEAGVPPGYLEVGTVYDCIPCLNKSRHAWSKRANAAEGELITLRAQLASLHADMETIAARQVPISLPIAEFASAAIADALSASEEPGNKEGK